MREIPLANCEKSFVIKSILAGHRLDGRRLDEFRDLKILFGADWGSAYVSMGETQVLAQVSCEIGQPKATRPNEGLLFIHVELGPMAALSFEGGRNSENVVRINRILERTIKDSQCVDLESLCISSEDKVWALRLDINILNYEGNIVDCASIAAISALAHFRRPDVTLAENEIVVHTFAEKDPIPMVLHHYPICTSYATFKDGELAVVDPTVIEERSSEANMIYGLNSFSEVCCINLCGTTLTSTNLLLNCAHRAADRSKFVVEQIKSKLQADTDKRNEGKIVGFAEYIGSGEIALPAFQRLPIQLRQLDPNTFFQLDTLALDIKQENLDDNIPPEIARWIPESHTTDSDLDEIDFEYTDDSNIKEKINSGVSNKMETNQDITDQIKQEKDRNSNSDSEEELTIILK